MGPSSDGPTRQKSVGRRRAELPIEAKSQGRCDETRSRRLNRQEGQGEQSHVGKQKLRRFGELAVGIILVTASRPPVFLIRFAFLGRLGVLAVHFPDGRFDPPGRCMSGVFEELACVVHSFPQINLLSLAIRDTRPRSFPVERTRLLDSFGPLEDLISFLDQGLSPCVGRKH